jgi:hypothetical protein
MQLALNHPATPAGPNGLKFFMAADGLGSAAPAADDAPAALLTYDGAAPRPDTPCEAAPLDGLDEDYSLLYDEERRRADGLEQRLASAMLLLHETAAERDRWHAQAQRALSLIDSLQRQLATARQPVRRVVMRRRRFLGLF